MSNITQKDLDEMSKDITRVLNEQNINPSIELLEVDSIRSHLGEVLCLLSFLILLLTASVYVAYVYGYFDHFLVGCIIKLRPEDYIVLLNILTKVIQSDFTEITPQELKFISIIVYHLGRKGYDGSGSISDSSSPPAPE